MKRSRVTQTKVMVTGATGFIGANLVRELLKKRYQVKALVRDKSNLKNIEDLDIEIVSGDLRDRASLDTALKDCEVLFHLAALHTFRDDDSTDIYETNVKGTENILSAAIARGIKKVVYTSADSTIGIAGERHMGTEEINIDPDAILDHYNKSKYLAERLALKMYRDGLPLVVVNPTVPVGPLDYKPTPTGKLIVDFLNRKMPAYVYTGINVIDVEDVAKGHILALEKGQIGERYILGNRNLTVKETLAILEKVSGLEAPRYRIPSWLALGMAYTDELIEGMILKRNPRISVAQVKLAREFRYFDCSKAINKLGLPQSSVERAFKKSVMWFRQNGYA